MIPQYCKWMDTPHFENRSHLRMFDHHKFLKLNSKVTQIIVMDEKIILFKNIPYRCSKLQTLEHMHQMMFLLDSNNQL